jgi:hypothetical protein
MRGSIYGAAAAAAAMLACQPSYAAAEAPGAGAFERRSGAFAGVRLSVPMGARNPERPSARLQVTSFHDGRSASGATVRSVRPHGIELGLGQGGRPAWRIGGREIGGGEQRLGFDGSTASLVTIGIIVLAAIVVIPVLTADPIPAPTF